MMEQQTACRQLDLVLAEAPNQRMNPDSRAEITSLLKFLLKACVVPAASTTEESDEQDHS
jgi:hypothetical protein